MTRVTVNPPKTPVTEGSNGVAAATLPNVCKMPGPPAPFVPTPLPNVGRSGTNPKNYSKSVTIEGKKVAIKGATFGSMGDVASKGTGGGMVSSNVEGPTSFVGPGSMNVKFEGKNVQLLGDPMLNNGGAGGSPPNSATLMGTVQTNGFVMAFSGKEACPLCKMRHGVMEETEQTRADASALASKLGEVLRNKSKHRTTMLGIVQCACNQNYVDQSGATRREFLDAAAALKWHAPAGCCSQEKVHSRLMKRAGTDPGKTQVIEDSWKEANLLASDSDLEKGFPDEDRTVATAYPPGVCAAQKALVLAWNAGAFPRALSEQWFSTSNKETGSPIEFLRAETGQIENRRFGPGQSVPPCKTCVLLLPLVLCPDEEVKKCQHQD